MNVGRVGKWIKKYWLYLAAFFIPWGIMVIFSVTGSGWLSGGGGILKGDMSQQLLPFFYGLWDKVHAGESFDYTWNIGGGIDFHIISGYLRSPFTIIVLLFPRNCITMSVQMIMVMKWALVNVSMVYFFFRTKHNTLTVHKKEISLFLGLAFGLGNGMLNFMGYIQFNDVMICFPILLLLTEKMVEEKKWKLYYFIMVYCMYVSIYLMFEICIFLLLWFSLQITDDVEERWEKFFLFAGSSVLAAATALSGILNFLLLSQGRLGTEDAAYRHAFIWSVLLPPKDFIKKLFILEPISTTDSLEPNVFFSIIGIMLVLFFFFIKVGKKKKIYMLFVSFLLLLSFFFGGLNIVWHCFAVPNGVYHRFSNLFVFMMLFFDLYVLVHLREIKLLQVLAVGVVVVLAFLYTFLQLDSFEGVSEYLLTMLLIVLYLLLFILFCKGSISYANMLLVIAVFGILELSVNAFYSIKTDYDYTVFWEETTAVPSIELSEQVELNNGEKIIYPQWYANAGLLTSQTSDGIFISSINGRYRELYRKLGMVTSSSVLYMASGTSPLINLMLNIRYGVGREDVVFSDADVVDENGDYRLYRMKRLAGLGYMVDGRVTEWDLSGTCFDVQNAFVKSAAGGRSIFHTVLPEVVCHDGLGMGVAMEAPGDSQSLYTCNYELKYGNETDSLVAEFTAEEDMDLYVCITLSHAAYMGVLIDDTMVYIDGKPRDIQTIHIGEVKKGQRIGIGEMPYNATIGSSMQFQIAFASFDEEAYAESYEALNHNVYQIDVQESNYLKGTIQVEKEGIMMTCVQAVDGMSVYVDGKQTEYVAVADALIGVPLSEGEHLVEFQYETPRSQAGGLISLGAAAVFCSLCMYGRKKQHRSQKTAV